MRVLLIEPSYKNKYPPLGLMKISTYHKLLQDEVFFCKGINQEIQSQQWDRIYVTTVFTFHWKIVINTIKYYLKSVARPENINVGGPMATIMSEEILREPGLDQITVLRGLLDTPGVLDDNEYIIDELSPDYSIIDCESNEYLDYEYPVNDAYFIHSTRGCIRKCEFCAVPEIEPNFKEYLDIKPRIQEMAKLYGAKKDLLIMDNNVLASPQFEKIIDDIIECGFGCDNNKFTYEINGKKRSKNRYVDFNQGLDARILYNQPWKMELISRVAVRPLRVAFDHADEEYIKIYTECMYLAAKNNIKYVSNYIFYNFKDTPNELYIRLDINVKLNKEFDKNNKNTRIWSFPMRYSPLFGEHAKDRKYVGIHWSRKQIRGVQCILNATHGLVGPKCDFFQRAFGKDFDEFNELLWMPDKYIIYRKENDLNGNIDKWKSIYRALSKDEKETFYSLIKDNYFVDIQCENKRIKELINLY